MSTTTYPPIPAGRLRQCALQAEACRLLESARAYGLLTGGPDVNVERCEQVIAQARAAGHSWGQEEIDATATALVAELVRGADG